MAAADPDRFRAALARSLTNLGLLFWELGRQADALPPAQEALEAYRELAATYLDQYRSDRASSLRVLALSS